MLTHLARDNNVAGIVGQILNIPVTCHPKHFPAEKYEYRSYTQNADAPMVSAARMRQFWNNYLPGEEEDPRASPLLAASLAGLPPTRKFRPWIEKRVCGCLREANACAGNKSRAGSWDGSASG